MTAHLSLEGKSQNALPVDNDSSGSGCCRLGGWLPFQSYVDVPPVRHMLLLLWFRFHSTPGWGVYLLPLSLCFALLRDYHTD